MRRTLLVHAWLQTALWVVLAVAVNHLAGVVYARMDVTADQRFGLSDTAIRSVARLRRPLTARVFFTRDLDPPYHDHELALRDLLTELAAASGGQLEVRYTDPTGDAEAVEEARRLGIRPVTYTRRDWDRQEARQVFMGVSFTYGERQQAVETLPSVERMEYEVVRAIRAITTEPDDRRTVGWLQGDGEPELASFGPDHPLGHLVRGLATTYDVVPVSLGEGGVPEEVDALLVVGPQLGLTARAQLELDQFVMRGGAVGFFLSGFQPDFRAMTLREVRHDLHGLLGHYGVRLDRSVVLDREHREPMVVPVPVGQTTAMARVSYPLALATTRIDRVHGPVRDLQRAVLPFATPLTPRDDLDDGREAEVWIASMPSSAATRQVPSLAPAALAQPAPDEVSGPFPLVVALSGTFPSWFVEREIPAPAGGAPEPRDALLVESAPTRIVVASSADMVANNLPMVQNAVDWLLEDPALISIRARTLGDPPLQPPPEDQALRWKLAIVGLPLGLLWAVGLLVWRLGRAR